MIPNRELSQMLCIAERYTHIIQKTNKELADVLFSVFVHEHNELLKQVSAFDKAEPRYRTLKGCYDLAHGTKAVFAKICADAQKDVVDDCITRINIQKSVVSNCIRALKIIALEQEGQ